MKVKLEEMFPWELSRALAEAPIGYLPLGTLEWHGEHNAGVAMLAEARTASVA